MSVCDRTIKMQSLEILPYNPGSIPTKPAPSAGDLIEFEVDGWPPWKDTSMSIRNRLHRDHADFVRLRNAASIAMDGRAWYSGPVGLDVIILGPEAGRKRSLTEYIGGIEDAIDGSHGYTFTYLPICFEDDAQICEGRGKFEPNPVPKYFVKIRFLSQHIH